MKVFLGLLTIATAAFAQEYNYQYQLAAPSPYGSYAAPAAPAYSAPAAPSYSAPSYSAKPSYAPVHAGPAQSYSYPSPSPPVKCGTNLLLSCSPNVAPVPCQSVSYSSPSYSAPSYSAPAAPAYSAPAAPAYSAPSKPSYR